MQRDFGNREDRQRARLKYLVDERGIEWFRGEVERRLGEPLGELVELLPWIADEHHGTRDGVIGLPVPSGKVADRDGVQLRTVLRELAGDGTVTAHPGHAAPGRPAVRHRPEPRRRGRAAPARPRRAARRRRHRRCAGWRSPARRCRRAARRSARPSGCCRRWSTSWRRRCPTVGCSDVPIRVNMTGCPNGCARPYTAEIGIVGRTKKTYDVYVGGSASGDRLGHADPRRRAARPDRRRRRPAVRALRQGAGRRIVRRLGRRRRRGDDRDLAARAGRAPPRRGRDRPEPRRDRPPRRRRSR